MEEGEEGENEILKERLKNEERGIEKPIKYSPEPRASFNLEV